MDSRQAGPGILQLLPLPILDFLQHQLLSLVKSPGTTSKKEVSKAKQNKTQDEKNSSIKNAY